MQIINGVKRFCLVKWDSTMIATSKKFFKQYISGYHTAQVTQDDLYREVYRLLFSKHDHTLILLLFLLFLYVLATSVCLAVFNKTNIYNTTLEILVSEGSDQRHTCEYRVRFRKEGLNPYVSTTI